MDCILPCLMCGHCSAYVDLDYKLIVPQDKAFCDVYGNAVPFNVCKEHIPKYIDFVEAIKLLNKGRCVRRPDMKNVDCDYIVKTTSGELKMRTTRFCRGYEDVDFIPYKFTADDIKAEDWYEPWAE